MMKIINRLPKPSAGQTLYCNCQKDGCFPCQHTGVVVAETEDGTLQLCKGCQKEYKTTDAEIDQACRERSHDRAQRRAESGYAQ